jgi:hypothetical protein
MMIVNYASSIVIKIKALLTDNARVIIYDCHVFIVQATGSREQEGTESLDPSINKSWYVKEGRIRVL